MKLAVVGGRNFNNSALLFSSLDALRSQYPIDELVSGGAQGADSLAEVYARTYNLPIQVLKPDWQKYGRAAGLIRNQDIIKNSDLVIAFWDGSSSGTKNSISLSEKMGKPHWVIGY